MPDDTFISDVELDRIRRHSRSADAVTAILVDRLIAAYRVLRDRKDGGWVSVEEGLPEPMKSVLLYYTAPNGRFVHEGWRFFDGRWILQEAIKPFANNRDVTHWQPLPAPPPAPSPTERTE